MRALVPAEGDQQLEELRAAVADERQRHPTTGASPITISM
jgi:hypothetical protein